MTRTQRIAPVQSLFADAERRLAQSFAACERRLAESEAKLMELQRYLWDYEQQFARRAVQGVGAVELRDYRAFLARLNEAIRQQQSVVSRAREERDLERQRWQGAARRRHALDHVVDNWRADERRAHERRDQRESDERAQRKVSLT
ncbi:MAG TPA: flagellar export protein FliJ [Steroidobacter sp.]|jgi:flagellar FliJ protein|nr:flagellar export protein FliJ [Steroidobacteraceae bacterium]HLS82572.1 flagellar export protein FliJ [Steroidobacter sp.]